MGKKDENASFTCTKCKKHILPLQNGSYRNHCLFCLTSIHVDLLPGDRKSKCEGMMFPYRLSYNGKKGWMITHLCQKCGHKQANKIAEGYVQPDTWELIIQLSQQQ